MSKTISDWIEEYEDRFRESFPYRTFGRQSDALVAIKESLKTGKEIESLDLRFTQ
jgi:hypothetical protein